MAKKPKLGPRHLHSLADLPHDEMLDEIAAGLPILLGSAAELSAAADALTAEHARARQILALHAEEEAAKAIMLIDMVRCPQSHTDDRKRLGAQLSNHLARLIYAESCSWRPADFAEVRKIVEGERDEYYLDGPYTGDEFIMRNRLIERREDILYADRILGEQGYDWHQPRATMGSEIFKPLRPAFKLADALNAVGAFNRRGLTIIHEIWSPIEIRDQTGWHEIEQLIQQTLEAFEKEGWLQDVPEQLGPILYNWPIPMYSLDCRIKPRNTEELQREREEGYWPV